MAQFTKDSLKKVKNTDMANLHGRINANIKDILKVDSLVEMENLYGMTAGFIKESGSKI